MVQTENVNGTKAIESAITADIASFDAAAFSYDAVFTHSHIGSKLRAITRQLSEKYLGLRAKEILEINCGTGEDAYYFAAAGNKVTATDVSPEMIKTARAKKKGTSNSLEFIVSDYTCLDQTFYGKTYDVVFSNFGGLNCANSEELKKVLADINTLLKPGGKLICVLMGTKCIWETTYYLLKGDTDKAYRRNREEGVKTKIGDKEFNTYYYSPTDIKAVVPKGLNFVRQHPVGFFIPPTYLEHYFKRHTKQLDVLAAMEKAVTSIPVLSNMADHYMLVFEKVH